MHPKHFEYYLKIFEQVSNNIAPLSDKTVNRAATPTKAILTQLCEKESALFKLYKELIRTIYSR